MTKKNIFPVVATIAVVGVVLGVFSTTVLRDSNVSISTMTSELQNWFWKRRSMLSRISWRTANRPNQ